MLRCCAFYARYTLRALRACVCMLRVRLRVLFYFSHNACKMRCARVLLCCCACCCVRINARVLRCARVVALCSQCAYFALCVQFSALCAALLRVHKRARRAFCVRCCVLHTLRVFCIVRAFMCIAARAVARCYLCACCILCALWQRAYNARILQCARCFACYLRCATLCYLRA